MRLRAVFLAIALLAVAPLVALGYSPPGFEGSTRLLLIETAGILLLGFVLVGLFQQRGRRALRTARESPIRSYVVGLVLTALWLGVSAASEFFWVVTAGAERVATFVLLAAAMALVAPTVGLVTVGTVLASAFGSDSPWIGLPIAAGLNVAFTVVPYVGPLCSWFAFVLGAGAAARVLLGGGSVRSDGRPTPPSRHV